MFGEYTFIEYFYYYVFNDAWNKHQGDWDSSVHLYIKPDRTYMVTPMHGARWLSRWPLGLARSYLLRQIPNLDDVSLALPRSLIQHVLQRHTGPYRLGPGDLVQSIVR